MANSELQIKLAKVSETLTIIYDRVASYQVRFDNNMPISNEDKQEYAKTLELISELKESLH